MPPYYTLTYIVKTTDSASESPKKSKGDTGVKSYELKDLKDKISMLEKKITANANRFTAEQISKLKKFTDNKHNVSIDLERGNIGKASEYGGPLSQTTWSPGHGSKYRDIFIVKQMAKYPKSCSKLRFHFH